MDTEKIEEKEIETVEVETLELLELKKINKKIEELDQKDVFYQENLKATNDLLGQLVEYNTIQKEDNEQLLASISENATTEEVATAEYYADLYAIVFFGGVIPIFIVWKMGQTIFGMFRYI